jgi:hypothetical protein
MEVNITKNWVSLIKRRMNHFFYSKGFYTFFFEFKEDRDLIFQNGSYFMGPWAMYLDRWTLYFDPEVYIHIVVTVWFKLPHLPLHCWGDDVLKSIGNTLGKYIDKFEPKPPLFFCGRICAKVDLEK